MKSSNVPGSKVRLSYHRELPGATYIQYSLHEIHMDHSSLRCGELRMNSSLPYLHNEVEPATLLINFPASPGIILPSCYQQKRYAMQHIEPSGGGWSMVEARRETC